MEKTNLNVAPYYDDFTESKDFHRVLFRPGFAVQARELTQLQSIMQNQIERFGRHIFKEGTVVIPGAVGYTDEYYAVKIESTLSGSDISSQIQDYVGKRITGTTSGVVAEVIQAVAATTDDPITLYVKYINTGSDNSTTVFSAGENISADGTVGSFGSGIDSAQLVSTNATAIGSSANIQEGVYFVRGHFVRVAQQRIILDKYTNTPNYRVGLAITEGLETPEEDTSLLDNAAGTSNFNAKGSHRLKFTLTLAKVALDSAEDTNFVELLRIKNGALLEKARNTQYSVLGETLARRTYDESGDYTVRSFDIDIRETLNDGLNNGVYNTGQSTDSGNTASDNFVTFQVSPGKAYVRGYEIETISPKFVDVAKPRTFESFNAAVTPVEVGNYVLIENISGSPEISPFISGEIDEPYRQIALHDQQTSSLGTPAGNKVGLARVRAFEHSANDTGSGVDVMTADAEYKLYLFDIRMFTKLTMSATPSAGTSTGSKVTGVTSGATGFIQSDTTGNTIVLTTVTGSFVTGEKIKSTSSSEADEILEDSGNTDLTISSIDAFDFSHVKQTYMNDPDVGDPDFTGDIVLQNSFNLTGLVSYASGTTVNGFQTNFTAELRVGDIVGFPTGAAGAIQFRRVTVVTNSTTITIDSSLSNPVTSVAATRKRAQLSDQQKNILLRKLQKNTIKTLKTEANLGVSDTQITIRRSFTDTSSASGVVTFTAGSNEIFGAVDNTDYVLTVITAGSGGSANAGQIVNLNSSNVTIGGAGTGTLSITSSSILGNGAEVRLISTITRTVVSEKTKTRTRMYQVLVDNDGIAGGAEYGTSAHHKDISLGVADVQRLWAVFDSEDNATDPVLPQWTITGATGTFTKGELITGSTSGAIARIVNTLSPITYVSINEVDFTSGETIIGSESGESATLDTFTAGSRVITNDFTLDNGQRDNFYDVGKLVRKPAAIAPSGRLLIVADYFSHGTGDFFSVDSYSSIDYKDIPTYTATRVDPEVAEPTGEYDLRDAVDFRPRVADATMSTQTIQSQTVYKVTSMSFNFENRSFAGTGSSTVGIPKDNSNFVYDFEHYIGRIDQLFLTSAGEFKIVTGVPSENPTQAKPLDDAMKLAHINMPPFVIDINDVSFVKENNRRYTMRDIGRLETRIQNMEYYTALNLLEKDAASLQIQDANGLDRFKSGFVVDNFAGHATGDVKHPDYRVAIDMQDGILRPKYFMKGISLEEENTTDAERTVDNYQLTGDVITLPYEHTVVVDQQYASRVENLNPVLNFAWAGICKLTPSGDEWFEVNRLPDLIVNQEGNFDTLVAQNQNAIGTVWNAWQTQWSGVTQAQTNRFFEHSFQRSIQLAGGRFRGRAIIERTISTREGTSSRSGIQTSIVAQIDHESQGDRVISQALIPFIRSKNITFEATGMKPLTRVYPFFDKTNVSFYCTPTGGSLGGALITSGAGRITGVFAIPNPTVRGAPRFRTGERQFRLTSDANNGVANVETFAQAIYSARGILSNVRETIIATRNARFEVREVNQTQNVTRQEVREDVVGWWDPLAQSFMPQAKGGEFITKVEVYFGQKDESLPVSCQIREMSNGYPTTKVLPFASKTLEPYYTGTVSMTNGSNVVTGSGTLFTTEFKVGDQIQVEGAYLSGGTLVTSISSVTSDTSMTLSSPAFTSVSGVKFGLPINSLTGNQFSDASAKTTFHFDAPVYVKDGVEYCIVLFTDSPKYTAWISRMGEVDVNGRQISEQPYLGVLFKSQNNTTWTAYDLEDLKFTLYRASFDTSKTSVITLVNESVPVKTLNANPIRTINGQNLVKVAHTDHHMYSSSNNVTLAGVASGINSTLNGAITSSSTSLTLSSSNGWPSSGTIYLKINNEVMTGSISGTTVSSLTRGVEGSAAAHGNGDAVALYQLNGIPLTEVNKTHNALANIGIDSYTVSTTATATADGTGGGSSVTATENAQMDQIHTLLPTVELPDTSVSTSVITTTGTSPSGNQTSFTQSTTAENIPTNDNYIFSTPKLIASQVNETLELSGNKSFKCIVNLNSERENLSPLFDLDRKSVIAVSNRINNIDSSSDVYPTTDFVSPTEPEGDNNEAVYVTRKVSLQNPATAIRMYVDAVQFDSAEIQAMYKILRSDDASDFDEIGWQYFNTNGQPDETVNASINESDFIERKYSAEGLEEFISFAIKIRLQGTNSCEVPYLKDLRAIALAT